MTTKSKTQDKHKMSEIDENISKLFDIKKRLGKGAYGIVWKALDKKTNETLAVKKIFDAFRDETDAQRTFREIIFLKAFRSHPNVIKLNQVYKASNNLDIYLIFEYMESDLHNIIKKGTILKDVHKRYVMYQLINAIKYIHSGNVIHRDLKPSNVLIDSKCRCKLADFGLARSVSSRQMREGNELGNDPVNEPLLTDYVATRWYRAPEILVASKRYTKGIDMWSLGCILGEMIRGKPLFQGSSTVNQIEKIVTALPDITDHDINAVGAGFGSVLLSKQISTERKTTLDELLSEAPDDAVHLVKSLLVLDPLSRLTAKQALCHTYVEKFRNSIPEIELNVDVLPPFRDDVRLSVPEYRSKLYEIVQVSGDSCHVSRVANSGKNITSNRHRELKKESIGYEKIDPVKKPSKMRHHLSNNIDIAEKYISKEQQQHTLTKLDKYEKNSQLSSSNASSTVPIKTHKKCISPLLKRKLSKISNKSHTSTTTTTEQKDIWQLSGDKPNGLLSKYKVATKQNPEPIDESIKVYTFEKRHSIDGGYGSLPAVSTHKQQSPTDVTLNAINLIRVENSSNKLYKSSSSLHKSDSVNNRSSSIVREEMPEPSELKNRSTPAMGPENKNSNNFVRNTKSEVMPTTTTKNQERICYEKRLKKLEEEIEKYKKEVKTFCKESFRYSTTTSSNNNQTTDTVKMTTAMTPTVANGVGTQFHHARLKHNSSSTTKPTINLPAMSSSGRATTAPVPIPASMNTPKKSSYYKILSKVNREFGKNDVELPFHSGSGNGDFTNVRNTMDAIKQQQHQQHYDNNHRFRPMSKFI